MSSRNTGQRKRSRSRSTSPPSFRNGKGGSDVAVFIYRRDFRLDDNTALHELCDKATSAALPVLPVFFFNPLQEDKKKNAYCGDACLNFLYESLVDLSAQLDGRLVCLEGTDTDCLTRLSDCGLTPRILGYNEDFTPFALQRDERLSEWCGQQQIELVTCGSDYSLLPLDTVVNGQNLPYSVFTPFYNCFMGQHASKVPSPRAWDRDVTKVFLNARKVAPSLVSQCTDLAARCATVAETAARISDHGGRRHALERLDRVSRCKNYQHERDLITPDRTTHLSPHLKFGTVSSREVWHRAVKSLGLSHPFVRQLVWREFYSVILCHHPRLVQAQLNAFAGPRSKPLVNAPFQAKYAEYKWTWKPAHFEAFKRGQTGVPLVDAAVRCVTQTGWCHNRCRMVIANFLVKTLSVDWREGEKWFATVAVDYDVANNNGGWLWSAGQGADAQPYFRTFNPFRQSERFDPDAHFIHQWVPELRCVPAAVVHDWENYCKLHKRKPLSGSQARAAATDSGTAPPPGTAKKELMRRVYLTDYPSPIVNIRECTHAVIAEFRKFDPK